MKVKCLVKNGQKLAYIIKEQYPSIKREQESSKILEKCYKSTLKIREL